MRTLTAAPKEKAGLRAGAVSSGTLPGSIPGRRCTLKETMMGNYKELTLSQLKLSEYNTRRGMDKDRLNELAESIKEKGILEPLVVRQIGPKKDQSYEIVCGSRRYAAAKMAGVKTIPVVVRTLTDEQAAECCIIENLQREDVHAVDEAHGYQSLVDRYGWTAHDIATSVAKSDAYVTGRLSLLKLDDETVNALRNNSITVGHAQVLARVADGKKRSDLLKTIVMHKMSVRRTENVLENYSRELRDVKFNKKDCSKCPHNGANQMELIDDDTDLKGRCLNEECYKKKSEDHFAKTVKKLEDAGAVVVDKAPAGSTFLADDHYHYPMGKEMQAACDACAHVVYVQKTAHYTGAMYLEKHCTDKKCFKKRSGEPTVEDGSGSGEPKKMQDWQYRELVNNAKDKHYIHALSEKLTATDAILLVALGKLCELQRYSEETQKSEYAGMEFFKHHPEILNDDGLLDRAKMMDFVSHSIALRDVRLLLRDVVLPESAEEFDMQTIDGGFEAVALKFGADEIPADKIPEMPEHLKEAANGKSK